MQNILSKPLVRYPGGKYALAPWIIQHLPPHRIYVEPFGGGASVLLNKDRSFSEIYNDLDCEIVNLFQVMRDHFADLERNLRYTPFSRVEFESAFETTDDIIERARRLLIRSWQSHNPVGISRKSGFRTNVVQADRSSVAGDWRKFIEMADQITERLQGVTLENRPAGDVIRGHDSPHTLFYVDPPYVLSTRKDKLYRHEMTDNDHIAMSEILHSIKGMVVLSGYDSELYTDLFTDWIALEREHYADRGGRRTEKLWISPRAWKALQTTKQKTNPIQSRLF